jgi:hypothetical protein
MKETFAKVAIGAGMIMMMYGIGVYFNAHSRPSAPDFDTECEQNLYLAGGIFLTLRGVAGLKSI